MDDLNSPTVWDLLHGLAVFGVGALLVAFNKVYWQWWGSEGERDR
jgi:hypothetical protein